MKLHHPRTRRLVRLFASLGAVAVASLGASHSARADFGGFDFGGGFALCSNPSDATCADSSTYIVDPPPDACTAQMATACGARLRGKWTASRAAAGTPKKLYLLDVPTDPGNLRDARWEPFDANNVAVLSQTSATLQGDVLWYKAALANPALAPYKDALKYGSQFSNDTNIASCSEYAYKRFWDYDQFQDDADACQGDASCIYDAAYTGAHSIAWKVLRQRNGVTPLDHQIELAVDLLPKNPFFNVPTAALFNIDPVDPTMAARIDAIKARITDGARWYGIGGATGDGDSFSDEWSYHQTLHDRIGALSDAEFEELALRRAAIQQASSDYAAALFAATLPPDTIPSAWGVDSPFPGGFDPAGWGSPDGVIDPDPIADSQLERVRFGTLVLQQIVRT